MTMPMNSDLPDFVRRRIASRPTLEACTLPFFMWIHAGGCRGLPAALARHVRQQLEVRRRVAVDAATAA